MPKKDRHALGVKTEQIALEIFELAMLARTKTGQSRLLILGKADVKLKILKVFVRLAAEMKAIPAGTYTDLEGRLLEIGKMLGGWIKTTKERG